jgi:hypothetical protein
MEMLGARNHAIRENNVCQIQPTRKAKAPSITRGSLDTKRRLPDNYHDKSGTLVVVIFFIVE